MYEDPNVTERHIARSEAYTEGYTRGVEWAQRDRQDSEPAEFWVSEFRSEANTSQRWARAFYLGALRGYRSVARTLKAGRWGL